MLELTYAMPCYNHRHFLVEALESIRADIHTHDLHAELLIIDDGSTDDSVAVIQKWLAVNSDLNVRLIEQTNHGIAKTVNKLYNTSRGRFVRLCASDDTIAAGSSVAMIAAAIQDDQVQCVFGDGTVIDNDSKWVADSFIAYHGGDASLLSNNICIPSKLISAWCIAGPCILVRRSFFDSYQYDENSRIDDFDFFLNLFKSPQAVFFLNKIVCAYRVHGNNTSKVKDVSVRIENLKSFLYLIEKYLKCPDLQYLKSLLNSKRFLTMAKISYLHNNYFLASFKFLMSKWYLLLGRLGR